MGIIRSGQVNVVSLRAKWSSAKNVWSIRNRTRSAASSNSVWCGQNTTEIKIVIIIAGYYQDNLSPIQAGNCCDRTRSSILWWPNITTLNWGAMRHQTCYVWSPSKRAKSYKLFDQMFDIIQILSNTIKQGVETEKCLVTKNGSTCVWSLRISPSLYGPYGFLIPLLSLCMSLAISLICITWYPLKE